MKDRGYGSYRHISIPRVPIEEHRVPWCPRALLLVCLALLSLIPMMMMLLLRKTRYLNSIEKRDEKKRMNIDETGYENALLRYNRNEFKKKKELSF